MAMDDDDTEMSDTTVLVGHIDRIDVGPGFVVVNGWAFRRGNLPAEPPITIMVREKACAGYSLGLRRDLAQVGIADGIAGFNAHLPISLLSKDQDVEVTLYDASGAMCVVTCPSSRIVGFEPYGYIEEVNTRYIRGWVFDPGLLYSLDTPRLFFCYDEVCSVYLTLQRPDLTCDVGDGLKTFGFVASSDLLRQEMATQLVSGGSGLLSLASSGFEVSNIKLSLEDGKVLAQEPARVTRDCGRMPASDWLNAFKIKDIQDVDGHLKATRGFV